MVNNSDSSERKRNTDVRKAGTHIDRQTIKPGFNI